MRLPMKVYELAQKGDQVAQEFIDTYKDQPGEYPKGLWQQFKGKYNNSEEEFDDNFEQDLNESMSPEEKRANKKIEEYGSKYGSSESDLYSKVDEIVDNIGMVSFANGVGYLPGYGDVTPESMIPAERDIIAKKLGISEEKANDIMINYLGFEKEQLEDNAGESDDEDVGSSEVKKDISNLGEKNGLKVAKMFEGECGPFGGEDPEVEYSSDGGVIVTFS